MYIKLELWVPNNCRPGETPRLLASISFSRLRIRVFVKTFVFATHDFGLDYVRVYCCILAKKTEMSRMMKDLMVCLFGEGFGGTLLA